MHKVEYAEVCIAKFQIVVKVILRVDKMSSIRVYKQRVNCDACEICSSLLCLKLSIIDNVIFKLRYNFKIFGCVTWMAVR